MKVLTKKALRVFNVLENYREGSDDILDALLPFFEQVFEDIDGKIYDPNEFATQVSSLYHWNFSSDIAEEFTPNFERKGWIKPIAKSKGVYKVDCPKKEANTEDNSEIDVKEKLLNLSTKFAEFISELAPLTAYNKTTDELSDIIIEWLVSADAYSEEVLEYSVNTSENEEGKLGLFIDIPDSSSLSSEDRYLAARFVKKIIEEDSTDAVDLCKIASIGLLTEVVQDFQHPTSRIEKTNLTIYLDAPIAMDFLGVSGKAAKNNITNILNGVLEIGGNLKICRVSIDEIKGALTGVLKRTPAERTGPTADAIRKHEVLEAYVREVAIDPSRFLEKSGVEIDEKTISQKPSEHCFFPTEAYDDLMGQMTFHNEINRREHDAIVMTNIMRRRRNSHSRDLFSANYVMLTRNGLLAQFANRYCKVNGHIDSNSIGPIIHQRQLATAIWLRTGYNHNSEEIPKRYILSACEKVLEVKKGLIASLKKASATFNPEQAEQFELLLTEDRSIQHIQDKTLGMSGIVSANDPDLLIATLHDGLSSEIRAQSEAEVADIKQQASTRIRSATIGRKNAEEKVAALNDNLNSLSNEDKDIINNTIARATNFGENSKHIIKVCYSILMVVFAIFLWFEDSLTAGTLKTVLTFLFGFIIPVASFALPISEKPLGISYLAEQCMKYKFNKIIQNNKLQSKFDKFDISMDKMNISISLKTPKEN